MYFKRFQVVVEYFLFKIFFSKNSKLKKKFALKLIFQNIIIIQQRDGEPEKVLW